MKVASVLTRPFRSRLRVPPIVLVLLAASAVLGNIAQFQERNSLRSTAEISKAETECRSRIMGYVDGLSIELDLAEAMGLLDQVGGEVPVSFEEAVTRANRAVVALEAAKSIREQATEICAKDPTFQPDQIPEP